MFGGCQMKKKIIYKHYLLSYKQKDFSPISFDYPLQTRVFFDYSELKKFMLDYSSDFDFISVLENSQTLLTYD